MGYISEAELQGLRVTKMIIHVVGRQGEPFAPQPQIAVQQEGFFRARIQSEAADGVHNFEPGSVVKNTIESMAREEVSFEAGAQDLARRFWDLHPRQSVSGAFFVLELRCDEEDVIFYTLIKYDYREAVELSEADGRSVLREIVQAFVKERRAVQKFCIVRVRGGVADDGISASDRMKEAPDLTDYFERYLDVSRSRSNSELSTKLNEALRGAVEDVRQHLPRNDVGGAIARAKVALQGRATVTNDDVVDAVMHAAERPDDEHVRTAIQNATLRRLRRQNLQDVEFRPDRRILQVQPRRIVRTVEEVKIEFPSEELGRSVMRDDTPQGTVFTITTGRLIEDGTVAPRAR